MTVHQALQVQDRVEAAGRDRPVLVVVTLDPWRDTPSRLATIVEEWGLKADGYLFSGEIPEVESVLDGWQVPRARDRRTGDIAHPAIVYVVDADGSVAHRTAGGVRDLLERLDVVEQD